LPTNSLIQKLGLKPGMKVRLLNAPPDYLNGFPLPDGAQFVKAADPLPDFIQLFATQSAEIAKTVPALLENLTDKTRFWITYPKKTSGVQSDLSREAVWAALAPLGWRPVTQIAIDEVWSALRFRPAEAVKTTR
jgi:hypothetical protein